MKKILAVLLVSLFVIVGFAACSNDKSDANGQTDMQKASQWLVNTKWELESVVDEAGNKIDKATYSKFTDAQGYTFGSDGTVEIISLTTGGASSFGYTYTDPSVSIPDAGIKGEQVDYKIVDNNKLITVINGMTFTYAKK